MRLLVILSVLCTSARCAKILGVFPAPGYSQYLLGETLMQELANRGHNVTVISAYSPKHNISNYCTIKTDGILEKTNSKLYKSLMLLKTTVFQVLIYML